MMKKGAWALGVFGDVYIDSVIKSRYFPTDIFSGSIVTVTVNISEGWIQFTLNEHEGRKLAGLPLSESPLYFACCTGWKGVS